MAHGGVLATAVDEAGICTAMANIWAPATKCTAALLCMCRTGAVSRGGGGRQVPLLRVRALSHRDGRQAGLCSFHVRQVPWGVGCIIIEPTCAVRHDGDSLQGVRPGFKQE